VRDLVAEAATRWLDSPGGFFGYVLGALLGGLNGVAAHEDRI
jgi:hypothetical protein